MSVERVPTLDTRAMTRTLSDLQVDVESTFELLDLVRAGEAPRCISPSDIASLYIGLGWHRSRHRLACQGGGTHASSRCSAGCNFPESR